jgi:biotin carboxyl carrier protein
VTYEVIIAGQAYRVELLRDLNNPQLWLARINSRELHFNAAPAGRDVLSIVLDGRSYEIMRETVSAAEAEAGTSSNIVIGGRRYAAELRDPRALRSRRAMGAHGQGPKKILSPMPGKVVRVLVAEGAQVEAGAGVIVVEAMKMQNELKSPKQGIVAKLPVNVGAAVNAGDVLAVIE